MNSRGLQLDQEIERLHMLLKQSSFREQELRQNIFALQCRVRFMESREAAIQNKREMLEDIDAAESKLVSLKLENYSPGVIARIAQGVSLGRLDGTIDILGLVSLSNNIDKNHSSPARRWSGDEMNFWNRVFTQVSGKG